MADTARPAGAPAQETDKSHRLMGRDEIETMIGQGSLVIIYDGYAIKTDAWLPYHPGGDKPILHMVGRDATVEINA